MPPASLPDLPSLDTIAKRLALIFPEATEHRGWVVRDIATKTVFVMLYVGAIKGSDEWIRPNQVARMTDEQSRKTSDEERRHWALASLGKATEEPGRRWYQDTTREPIRDETLRFGLIPTGAVIERSELPTTSAKPRYALTPEFAALFDEALGDRKLTARIEQWQDKYLDKSALARVRLVKAGLSGGTGEQVPVKLPNGDVRHMAPGKSSIISKAVIEQLATRFLRQPGVLFLSEPGHKVVAQDDTLARSIGLIINPAKHLPDIILVDLGAPRGALLVFVEVVATDGPVTGHRKEALLAIAHEAGFGEGQVAFVTAFLDRSQAPVRKSLDSLAWGSFVWFAAEPDKIVTLHDAEQIPRPLWEIMPSGQTTTRKRPARRGR